MEGLENPDHVANTARTVLNRLSAPVRLEAGEVAISGSIGIAIYPLDANTREELIQYADAAMYQAKSSGGNAFVFHSSVPPHLPPPPPEANLQSV